MQVGDLLHDREPEPAAGAARVGRAIEALEHALALLRRDADARVFHLEERTAADLAAPNRHAPGRGRVRDRVLREALRGLGQQPFDSAHRSRRELRTEVEAGGLRGAELVADRRFDDRDEIEILELPIGPRGLIRARKHQELLRGAAEPARGIEHSLQAFAALGVRLVRAEHLDLCLDAGERRAQLMGRVVEKLALTRGVVAHRREQAVQLVDERADLARRVARADGREVLRRALRDLPLHVAQRLQRQAHADPNDREDDAEHEHVGRERAAEDPRAQVGALVQRFAHRHGDLVVAGVGSIRDQADRVAAIHGVGSAWIGRGRRWHRQIGISRDERAVARPDAEVDRVLGGCAQHRERIRGQIEPELAVRLGMHVRRDRERGLEQRLIERAGERR